MNYSEKWKVLEEIGGGGQSKVYHVCRAEEYTRVQSGVSQGLRKITAGVRYVQQQQEDYNELRKWLPKMLEMEDPANQFALKVLHKPENARAPESAKERIKREIAAMLKNLHPNLITLVDSDPDGGWYVSQFYPGGTLTEKRDAFKGDFLSALKAVRPIIEGVAKLHKEGYVHRDIKPDNIFVGAKNELILGDFGLVFFEDAQHTRISETYENVGSRDWMPGWAVGMRIDEVKPTFDVFSLGKVLWAMISVKPILRLWYFKKDEFNVERMFPSSASIKWANPLFEKCIVEEEKDCLPNAGALLQEIDKMMSMIESDADRIIDVRVKRRCRVCGLGEYELVVDGDEAGTLNFGFHHTGGGRKMKIFTCNNCGNVQVFSYIGKLPSAWSK